MLAKESREMLGIMDNLRYNGLYLSLSRLWYTAPPMKGGATPVHICNTTDFGNPTSIIPGVFLSSTL